LGSSIQVFSCKNKSASALIKPPYFIAQLLPFFVFALFHFFPKKFLEGAVKGR